MPERVDLKVERYSGAELTAESLAETPTARDLMRDRIARTAKHYLDESEIAALREENRVLKEALGWLEEVGFSTVRNGRGGCPKTDPGVHSWRDREKWKWTAAWIDSECTSALEAIQKALRVKAGLCADCGNPNPGVSSPPFCPECHPKRKLAAARRIMNGF
ncbi:MAG TPA: hypothetical protein VNH18_07390 [Bryobacteraceae bacterium]|nr:hypothetical protein [Bryobacteraceae bacterium]